MIEVMTLDSQSNIKHTTDDFNEADLNLSEFENNSANNRFLVADTSKAIAGVYDWIGYVLVSIVAVVLCLTFVFRLVNVKGSSMCDTLNTADKVIVTNFMYTPTNGDIVVISHGEIYDEPIIKRVIATEGQTVQLDYANDRIIVDGVVLDEPYIKGTTFGNNIGDNEIPEVIPSGKLFVLGDNREISKDSRSMEIGLIDVENVVGKAQIVAFPISDFGYLY